MEKVRTAQPSIASLAIMLFCLLACVGRASAEDRGLNVVARALTGNPDFDAGRQVAVIIGIDRYKEWPSLRSAVSEAKALRQVLDERYVIDEFVELYDAEASGAGIRRLFIETLPAKLGPKDSLLVFYAGHGYTDATKTGFWIASDGTKDQYSQNNWIPNQQIRNMIGSLKAQRILILADACFSGDFLNVARGVSPTIDNAYYKKALQLTARQVLTSGSSESVPDDSEFGRQLINLLERNEAALVDPVTMYERLRLGVSKTLPLLGTLPGNEEGASFALFLKGGTLGAGTVTPTAASLGGRKPAELMVRASEAGAEVLVDGVSRGQSPLLVSALPSGRSLRVEARTKTSYGALDLSLNPGELREVSVAMAARTGNLVIVSNESAVRVILDGLDKGSLGSGVLRDLPVGSHELELLGQDLYYSTTVTIPPEASAQIAAQVLPVGSLALKIPAEAAVSIEGGGQSRIQRGPGVLANLPTGSYTLSVAGQGDWIQASARIGIAKGQQASWEPWKDGSIAFNVSPSNTMCLLYGAQTLETGRPATGIAPGNYRAILRKPGYHDQEITIAVALGRATSVKASLERLSPGAMTVQDFGIDLSLLAEGQSFKGVADGAGKLLFKGLPAGYPLTVSFKSKYVDSLALPDYTISLVEGQTVYFELLWGRIALPWTSPGATVEILNSLRNPSELAEGGKWISEPLLAGNYRVAVGGMVTYTATAQVRAGTITELPGYRDAAMAQLASARAKSSASLSGRRTQGTLGIVSLATGLVGAAGAGAAYYLGGQAMQAYKAAASTAEATSSWANVKLFSTILPLAAGVGAFGIGLSPMLLFNGPDPKALETSIGELDKAIKELGK